MLPGVIAHIPLAHVLGAHACGRIALHVHALHAAAVEEIVHVGRTPGHRQRLVDLGERYTQRARLLAIDVQLERRRVLHAIGTHASQRLVLCRHAEQLVARGQQGVVTDAAAILQHHVEARGGAQFRHRGLQHREDLRVADGGEVAAGALCHRFHVLAPVRALVPGLQLDEHQAHVLAHAREAEAGDGEHAFDHILLLVQEVVARQCQRRLGALARAARRRLHDAEHGAAVLVRRKEVGMRTNSRPSATTSAA